MSSSTDAQVSQLYVALFGRAPDAEGLAFWAGKFDAQLTFTQVAEAMYATAPARAYYPDGATDSQVISSFYLNVLGRTADAEGLAYWTEKLTQPGATRSSVLADMVDVVTHYFGTDTAGLESARLFGNRVSAGVFYGENGGSIENATQVLAGVTSSVFSVLDARVLVKDSASGSVDAGGYSSVTFKTITGDVVLWNVLDGVTLRVDKGSDKFAIDVDLLDPSGTADDLTVYLPGADTENRLHLRVPGYESLHVIAPSHDAIQILSLSGTALATLQLTGSAWTMAVKDSDPLPPTVDPATVFADLVDASSFTVDSLDVSLSPDALLLGGDGVDTLWGTSESGATAQGSADDDELGGFGVIAFAGGAGHDQFRMGATRGVFDATIADFQVGIDRFQLDLLATNHLAATSTNVADYGVWYADQVVLDDTANFQNYLNAAAKEHSPTLTTYAEVSWFQYGGDTYVFVDNSNANTFVSGLDRYVKLTGLVDLHGLQYDSQAAVLG